MMKAFKLVVLLVTAVFASVQQEVSEAENKLVAEVEHHRRPHRHHHRHRRCHSSSSSSSSSSEAPCCQQGCGCPWKEGKNRVKILSQRYLDLMFARQYSTAATLLLPNISDPKVAPRCPDGKCCYSSNTEAYLGYYTFAYSFKQMEKVHEVKEHGRSGYDQSYEVSVPVNFYLDPFSELAMNVHMTWVWQADCNLKISAVSLTDIRCLSKGGCGMSLKHNWYPTAPIIPTCTTECVDFAEILRVTTTFTESTTTTTPILTTTTTTSTTTSTTTTTETTTTTSTEITTSTETTTTTTTTTDTTTVTEPVKAFPTDAN